MQKYFDRMVHYHLLRRRRSGPGAGILHFPVSFTSLYRAQYLPAGNESNISTMQSLSPRQQSGRAHQSSGQVWPFRHAITLRSVFAPQGEVDAAARNRDVTRGRIDAAMRKLIASMRRDIVGVINLVASMGMSNASMRSHAAAVRDLFAVETLRKPVSGEYSSAHGEGEAVNPMSFLRRYTFPRGSGDKPATCSRRHWDDRPRIGFTTWMGGIAGTVGARPGGLPQH